MVSTALALRSASSLDRFKAWRTDMLLRLFFVSFLTETHTQHSKSNNVWSTKLPTSGGVSKKKSIYTFELFADFGVQVFHIYTLD